MNSFTEPSLCYHSAFSAEALIILSVFNDTFSTVQISGLMRRMTVSVNDEKY